MRFDLVLFDLDGTLVDSLPDIAGALNSVLGSVGLPPLSLDVVRGLVGEGVLRLVEGALVVHKAHQLDAAALARQVVDAYAARPCMQTRLYAGITPTLQELRRRGLRLAVLTNKMGRVARALLAALEMGELFEAIVGDGDGHARKPAPDAAIALFQRLGVDATRSLMVGDGLPDLALARAAGCPVAACAWGYTARFTLEAQRPDFVIDNPADLLSIAG